MIDQALRATTSRTTHKTGVVGVGVGDGERSLVPKSEGKEFLTMAHKAWSEIRAQSRAEPELVADLRRAMERELTLAELRRARELTQTQLAAALETSQSGVSQIEKRTDLYVSTLRSYVEALGGHLEVTAVFPDAVVPIRTFAELDDREVAV